MKRILFIVFLLPLFVKAQDEIRHQMDFIDTLNARKFSSRSSFNWVGRSGTTFTLVNFDSIYVKGLGKYFDSTRHKIMIYDPITGTTGYAPWLYAGGGSSGVTSVSAGLGMNFTTITATGSVILDTSYATTKGTTQVLSGLKAFTNEMVLYENNVSAVNQLTFKNDGSNSSTKTAKLSLQGQTGFGLTGWPNAVVSENAAAGGYLFSAFGGGNIKFSFGAGRSIMQNFTAAGAFFGGTTTAGAYVDILGSTTTQASLRIRSGTAPTSPNDGDIWTDANHIYSRLNSVTYQLDQQSGSGMTNPMTTTGDIIYSSSGSTPARLGIGSTNKVLTVISGLPSWQTPTTLLQGTYVPTITNTTNVSSSSNISVRYRIQGSQVIIIGTISVTATVATANTVVSISLPSGATSNFTSSTDAAGIVGEAGGFSGLCTADVAGDLLVLTYTSGSALARSVSFSLAYDILP